ncbi:MAG: 5-formyltetrahydrofolate cyclo-ligase [Bdellovibrionales bacterium]|nr:5-formyltetrahydrofolate cyclo-ligase [Bdellovibrionales bacterium]
MSKKLKRDAIRLERRKLLANLDSRWTRAASLELCERLIKLLGTPGLANYTRLLAWTSFFPGEPDLSAFIARMESSHTIYLPRSLPDRSMLFISIGKDWMHEVTPGIHGIPEPLEDGGEQFESSFMAHETVVLVPGVAFDSLGNRLGRGRGYYDRFLGDPEMETAKKIGVCWKFQLAPDIPTRAHDIPVDYVCHEEGSFRTSLDRNSGDDE